MPGLGIRYAWRMRNITDRGKLHTIYLEEGTRFSKIACNELQTPHASFFGYTSASLECLRFEKEQGRWTVLDQIDPGPADAIQVVQEEEREYPGLSLATGEIPNAYIERVRAEWALADIIVVNSTWSKDTLISQGIDARKIQIVALPFFSSVNAPVRKPARQNLRVLFLGTLSLRKGVHYAVEAATKLLNERVSFTFAGPTEVDMRALGLPANAIYIGQIPRSRVAEVFLSHDVFLFPTLSDGFGLTQVEAMAYGLPVIATKRCGEVVEHGRSGFIVAHRDSTAIADALRFFLERPELLSSFSESALHRSRQFAPWHQWPIYKKALRLEPEGS
jgi:glycosyltransferase involved in cell wall biosynthesis